MWLILSDVWAICGGFVSELDGGYVGEVRRVIEGKSTWMAPGVPAACHVQPYRSTPPHVHRSSEDKRKYARPRSSV